MDERTRAYLRGRFRDYYRRNPPPEPPAAATREWGYIPWSEGGTTMIRHNSLYDLGDLGTFLAEHRPQHVYFSAGRYRDPGANTMGAKGWQGSDLIFDLDADHLPAVNPSEDSYAEMLAACKAALTRLLSFLREDFAFDELTVVFSGSRGYHVHVRDSAVQSLSRDARREIVDYIRGIDVDFETVITTETVAGMGRKTPTEKRTLDLTGGWSRRAHEHLTAFLDELLAENEDAALTRLQSFDGVGPQKAKSALRAARENRDAIRSGNIDIHPAFYTIARQMFDRALERDRAAIDEPVTTDIHRLIRLPGSLHGGTGLRVTPIEQGDLDAFDPLVDAIPAAFTNHDIRVRLAERVELELNGETFRVNEGVTVLPEYAAIYLMADGRAVKETE